MENSFLFLIFFLYQKYFDTVKLAKEKNQKELLEQENKYAIILHMCAVT